MQKDNLYFGGGTLLIMPFAPDNTPDRTRAIDIGCLELSLSKESQKTTAWTRAYGAKQKLAEVITEENWTIKIKGNNFSPEALSLVLGSEVYHEVVAKDHPLPYGGIASQDTSIAYLKAGSAPKEQSYYLEFIGASVMGKALRAIFYQVNLSLDGDLNLMAEEFSTLNLSGACARTEKGVYNHYVIDARSAQASLPSAAPSSFPSAPSGSAEPSTPSTPSSAQSTPSTPSASPTPSTEPSAPSADSTPIDPDQDLKDLVDNAIARFNEENSHA